MSAHMQHTVRLLLLCAIVLVSADVAFATTTYEPELRGRTLLHPDDNTAYASPVPVAAAAAKHIPAGLQHSPTIPIWLYAVLGLVGLFVLYILWRYLKVRSFFLHSIKRCCCCCCRQNAADPTLDKEVLLQIVQSDCGSVQQNRSATPSACTGLPAPTPTAATVRYARSPAETAAAQPPPFARSAARAARAAAPLNKSTIGHGAAAVAPPPFATSSAGITTAAAAAAPFVRLTAKTGEAVAAPLVRSTVLAAAAPFVRPIAAPPTQVARSTARTAAAPAATPIAKSSAQTAALAVGRQNGGAPSHVFKASAARSTARHGTGAVGSTNAAGSTHAASSTTAAGSTSAPCSTSDQSASTTAWPFSIFQSFKAAISAAATPPSTSSSSATAATAQSAQRSTLLPKYVVTRAKCHDAVQSTVPCGPPLAALKQPPEQRRWCAGRCVIHIQQQQQL